MSNFYRTCEFCLVRMVVEVPWLPYKLHTPIPDFVKEVLDGLSNQHKCGESGQRETVIENDPRNREADKAKEKTGEGHQQTFGFC